MNPAMLCCFLPLLIVLIVNIGNKKTAAMIKAIRKKRGHNCMLELIEKYTGKECLIYTMNSQITGKITAIKDNWIEVLGKDGGTEAINADYVLRIREYPRGKNGKKKTFVAD